MVMKKFWKTIVSSLVLILLLPTWAWSEVSDDAVWADTAPEVVARTGERRLTPDRYRLLALNRQALDQLLTQIPLETAGQDGAIMSMPLPEGGFGRFRVVESPIMAPELAAKYPQLKTYRGDGIDDPTASIRFSFTPEGFHAMILSAGATIYIDPYQAGDDAHYISYLKQDYNANDRPPFQCHFQNDSPRALLAKKAPVNLLSFGTQLRTYRLALAATGEYTDFHCNQSASCNAGSGVAAKKQAALTAMVVAMNRVNGIYERDVAVRMTLIGNNDQVIFTDAATDPYSNNNGGAMLGQNQSTLDTIIGDANYDVGHVFSTGGGGVASLQVPCKTGSKARGVTGLTAPVGDPFYVDFVAHEIGHQYGGTHTFNGTAGNCAGGNRTASTAYEPGSGTTIMGYAGICPPQNTQFKSDDYFHAASLDQIIAFITGNGFSNGDVCAAKSATGNIPPTADAGSNANPAFTIPINTPFELTGSASDANGDTLTYGWEQFDLGSAGAPDSPTDTAPIFRSFAPTTNATRTFSQLSDIVDNTQTIGELLPSYTRDLTFRLTVRDNRSGGGGSATDTIRMQASAAAGPFQVTAPNSAVSWTGFSTRMVSWNVANTNIAPVNCNNVDILLSGNGGTSFPTMVLAGTPNDGSQSITVPNVATTQARLKIKCSNNVFFDVSNTDFTITAGVSPILFEDQFEAN